MDTLVRFVGELPFYIPVPDNLSFTLDKTEGERLEIWFEEFEPPRHPDEGRGLNVDDGAGTYLRSRVYVEFPVQIKSEEDIQSIDREGIRDKVIREVNRFIDAYRYTAGDPSANLKLIR